jgi:hypothetical protein
VPGKQTSREHSQAAVKQFLPQCPDHELAISITRILVEKFKAELEPYLSDYHSMKAFSHQVARFNWNGNLTPSVLPLDIDVPLK